MNVLSPIYMLLSLSAAIGSWIFSKRTRLYWIVLANIAFLWFLRARTWEWLYVVLLSLWIYGIALLQSRFHSSRFFSTVGVLLPTGVLALFKYGGLIGQTHVLLLGLSFYTFKAISYVIDVARGQVAAQNNPLAVFAYIAFFPTFMAGPIHRSAPFFADLQKPFVFHYQKQMHGLFQILIGTFEKLVIAGILQELTVIFQDSEKTGWYTVAGILFYGFYLYADFDAYSQIAVGIARLLGFQLSANFKSPYMSASMGEFWRRWHVSLGTWLRDYIYIPLGGSRKGTWRKHVNVLIVFLVSGIWHGNTWMFILWGLGCGAIVLIEQDLAAIVKIPARMKGLCILGNDLIMMLLWVLFCSPSLAAAMDTYRRAALIFHGAPPIDYASVQITDNTWIFGWSMLAVLMIFDFLRTKGNMIDFLQRRSLIVQWLFVWLLLAVGIIFGAYGPGFHASSFVYSRF